MQCPRCGVSHDDQARFCPQCGLSLCATPVSPDIPPAATEAPLLPRYAGFWRRALALLIDELIIGSVTIFFSTSYLFTVASGPDLEAFKVTALSHNIFGFLLHWLYFTLLESSAKQATVGKMAIGIIVTDLDGRRISWLRANGRYFGKIISALILGIGFLMAGFTKKKQALHDMLAETLVIMKG